MSKENSDEREKIWPVKQMHVLTCVFCGKQGEYRVDDSELCWCPDFWDGDTNYDGPVCHDCDAEHIEYDEETCEPVLKPGHPLPPSAKPIGGKPNN
jgi:hypothetical protein